MKARIRYIFIVTLIAFVIWLIGELILMHGYANRIVLTVEYLKPVVHIRTFLRRYALYAFIVDGCVAVPCDFHIESAY